LIDSEKELSENVAVYVAEKKQKLMDAKSKVKSVEASENVGFLF
jgi:hypothetical protein